MGAVVAAVLLWKFSKCGVAPLKQERALLEAGCQVPVLTGALLTGRGTLPQPLLKFVLQHEPSSLLLLSYGDA